MAERVGFEPTLEFPLNTLSKRAPSATRPSLRRRLGLESLYRLLEMKTDGAMASIHLIAATLITMSRELCECTRIGQKKIRNLALIRCQINEKAASQAACVPKTNLNSTHAQTHLA